MADKRPPKASASAPDPGPQPTPIFARARLRLWLREQIEGVDVVSQTALTSRGLAWLKDDMALLMQFADEAISPMVAAVVASVVAETRGTNREILSLGNAVINRSAQEQKGVLRARFGHWLEFDGRQNVNVLRMNRTQLLSAAAYRAFQSRKDRALAATWRNLASQMPDDNVVVGDVFTADEIEQVYVAEEKQIPNS